MQSSHRRVGSGCGTVDAFSLGVTPVTNIHTHIHSNHMNTNTDYNFQQQQQQRQTSSSIRYPLHLNSAVLDEVEDLEGEKTHKRKLNVRKVKMEVPIVIKQQPIMNHGNERIIQSSRSNINSNTKARTNKNNTNNTNKKRRTVQMKKRKIGTKSQTTSTIRVSNLLTKEEEVSYTTAIRDLRSVIRIRDEISVSKTMNNPGSTSSYIPNPMYKYQHAEIPFKLQPTEQEWAQSCNMSVIQLRRILVKGREARKCLVDGNVGLVTQIANKYSNALQKSTNGFDNIGCILTLGDLIQEGNMGLMEAAERFEADRGFRFATYAVHWVRSRILRCIADNSRVIRLPAHVHATLRTIRKAKSEMEQDLGRLPSMPELAHRLQMPISKIQLYTDSSLPVLSLEVPLNNGRSSSKSGSAEQDKRTLMDKIASDAPTPQEDAEFDALRRDIHTAIGSLGSDLERDVLINRFGLADGNPRTMEETAHMMGISRDKVRRLEARALNKLRHPQRNYMLKEYVENTSYGGNDGSDDRRDDTVNYPSSGTDNNGNNGITHFGDDSMNQFTPEMIWSF